MTFMNTIRFTLSMMTLALAMPLVGVGCDDGEEYTSPAGYEFGDEDHDETLSSQACETAADYDLNFCEAECLCGASECGLEATRDRSDCELECGTEKRSCEYDCLLLGNPYGCVDACEEILEDCDEVCEDDCEDAEDDCEDDEDDCYDRCDDDYDRAMIYC